MRKIVAGLFVSLDGVVEAVRGLLAEPFSTGVLSLTYAPERK